MTRVARAVFERHLRTMARDGWRTVTLAEYAAAARGQMPAPDKTFLLTFDDGYASLCDEAYPIVADLGFTAATFLITDFVGRTNTWDVRYTWNRLRHLDWAAVERWRGRGFDFGSHGATHRRLTWLTLAELSDDLQRARHSLVHRLGVDCGLAVAYPFGAWNRRITACAATLGYQIGFAGPSGGGGGESGDDPLSLPRLPVYLWDIGDRPLGLRQDGLGQAGRWAARIANRCAVGTSWMMKLQPFSSRDRHPH